MIKLPNRNRNRPYYTLATRTDGVWSPQFGDYDREVVVAERSDTYVSRFRGDTERWKIADIRIITHTDDIPQALAVDRVLNIPNKKDQRK